MKKRIWIGMLLMAVATAVGAQISYTSGGSVDENAERIMKKAAAQFSKNVSFDVRAIMLDGEKKQTAAENAKVLYNNGKYRVSTKGQELISDGASVWHWNKEAKEVAVSNIVKDDINPMNPGSLLGGYAENFRSKYIRTEEDGAAVIDLQPKSSQYYHKIRLFVDEKTGVLRKLEVHRYDSSREVYDITNFKKASTGAAAFRFDAEANKGVEIIDMR